MGKVAIYARVSTIDKQDFTRQVSDCKTAIGSKYNENEIEIFGERISGYKENEKRLELNRLLNIIISDPSYFEVIYITEISRLGRDPKSTRLLIDELTEKKIPIFITSINRSTLDENFERDSIMNIILQVLIEFSDSESRTMKRRSKSGILQSIVNGTVGGGKNTAYGYTKDAEKKMIIHEEESEIIKNVFNLYKEGNGVKKIATILNNSKVPTRVNKSFGEQVIKFNVKKKASEIIWSDKTILDIIKNPLYKGQRRFKGNLYDAPAIITTELFDNCNELLLSKTHRNSLITYNYLLKDLLICSKCGRNMFAKYKPTKGGDKVYICSSRLKTGGNCGNVGVNISLIESVLYDVLITSEILLKYLDKSDEIKKSTEIQLKMFENDINILKTEKGKFKNRFIKVLKAFEDGDIDSELYKERNNRHKLDEKAIDDKILLISKKVTEQKDILSKVKDSSLSEDFLNGFTSKRIEIIKIFQQFIKSIYITRLTDDKEVLIDVFISMAKNEPGSSLKILLDLNQLRFKKLKFSYRMLGIELVTVYENGILKTNFTDIIDKFQTRKGQFIYNIPENNILTIE